MGKEKRPTHAFQVPCSTVFPKRTHHEDKYLKNRYKKVVIHIVKMSYYTLTLWRTEVKEYSNE